MSLKKNLSQTRLRTLCLGTLCFIPFLETRAAADIKNTASYNSFLSRPLIGQTTRERSEVTHSPGLSLHGSLLIFFVLGSKIAKDVANVICHDNGAPWFPVPSEVLVMAHREPGEPVNAHRDMCKSITTTEIVIPMSCPPDGGSMALVSNMKDGLFLHQTELSPDPEHWGWVSPSQDSEGLAAKSLTTTHMVHCTVSWFIQLQNPPPFPLKLQGFTSATVKRNQTFPSCANGHFCEYQWIICTTHLWRREIPSDQS